MKPDREAAVRGLLEAIAGILDIPVPVHHGDDGLYLIALTTHIDTVERALHGLLAGTIDNVQVQEAGRVLHLAAAALPLTYEAAS